MNSIMIMSILNKAKNWDYYSDTDSLVHETETENVYDDFSKNEQMFVLVIILLCKNITMIQAS